MIKIAIQSTTFEISGVDNLADQLKCKRIPGREYDHDRDTWIVPIRPGVAQALREIFGWENMGLEVFEAGEQVFMERIEPPAPGSVDPWKVTSTAAVELATLHHFYTVHGGDRDDYQRIHLPYVRGE